jgi:hypothetical protein
VTLIALTALKLAFSWLWSLAAVKAAGGGTGLLVSLFMMYVRAWIGV